MNAGSRCMEKNKATKIGNMMMGKVALGLILMIRGRHGAMSSDDRGDMSSDDDGNMKR